ncbi:hypothetical protein [Deinococcus ruber]|uniref:Uncharacterized protein n=1 Tax=Deinococcus ruber TaxID=1848197 RepID=A0A918F5P9_9DEIO|nr:hypothetical protein [Deinococcus ruber]GGR11393.1 hypothetical protein GCM10008957_25190 [Deinococcus ruber]
MSLWEIEAARAALRRARARERYENTLDRLMASGVDWGKGVDGNVPPSNLPYKEHDRPAREHLQRLFEQSLGAAPPSAQERHKVHDRLMQDIFTD